MGAERIFETQKKELSGDGISIRYDIAICKNWQCVWGKFRIFRQFFFCVREGWGQEVFCLTVKNIKKRKTDVNNKRMLSDIYTVTGRIVFGKRGFREMERRAFMGNEDTTPSESEWLIMEVFWESDGPLTSSAVIQKLKGKLDMTPKMIRVLMNRLCQKGILSHTVDEKDSRVYHYSVLKSKEECLRSKSRRFADSYFSGNQTGALASLIQSIALTDEQISELEEILEKSRGKGKK